MAERFVITALGTTAGALLLAPILADPTPRLIWNASASTPRGLYRLSPGAMPNLRDWVVVQPPADIRTLAAERHYLPANVPLVKRVAAVAGQHVCGNGVHLLVDGFPVARQRTHDPSGRALPRWRGCRRLGSGEFLVLGETADSFDSRYFGPVRGEALLGKAVMLWAR